MEVEGDGGRQEEDGEGKGMRGEKEGIEKGRKRRTREKH